MQELKSDQLIELAGLLVTLMIFFSIDAKHRFSRKNAVAKGLFRFTSIGGGLMTAISLVVVWVETFLPDGGNTIPVLFYFVPTSLAILAALVLAIEVVFLRKGNEPDE